MENHKCSCCDDVEAGCSHEEAIQRLHAHEQECMEKYGFYVHYVSGDSTMPANFQAHTHGLKTDFQIVLPLQEKTVHNILCTLAERSLQGEVFSDGQEVSNVISNNYRIRLCSAYEDGREVLRVIFPGPDGELLPDKIAEDYQYQYIGCTISNFQIED